MPAIIADHTETAVIYAPVEIIDLTAWLFSLTDGEYRACSKDHLACGSTIAENGKRLSLNVEQVAGNLLIQRYLEDISTVAHCRVHSISDSFSAAGHTKLDVTWEVTVKTLSGSCSEFSNRVVVKFTDDFLQLLENAHITDIEAVKAGMAEHVIAHNQEETPLFAVDIERKAQRGTWIS